MSAACRSCGAPIVWAVTKAGKRMPLDASPVPFKGLFGLELVDGDDEYHAVHKNDLPESARLLPLHQSHYVTCPQAAKWRRKGK